MIRLQSAAQTQIQIISIAPRFDSSSCEWRNLIGWRLLRSVTYPAKKEMSNCIPKRFIAKNLLRHHTYLYTMMAKYVTLRSNLQSIKLRRSHELELNIGSTDMN
jgi:hypothetical protein